MDSTEEVAYGIGRFWDRLRMEMKIPGKGRCKQGQGDHSGMEAEEWTKGG